jgi:hypothetical protein
MATRIICREDGKTCFDSQSQVAKEANRLSAMYGKYLKYYFCHLCKSWHLTSTKSAKQLARERKKAEGNPCTASNE